jgi:nucleoid-associated protein YgaU
MFGTQGGIEKAKIQIFERDFGKINSKNLPPGLKKKSDAIYCNFNPESLSISYKAQFTEIAIAGQDDKTVPDDPKIDYQGPGVTAIKVDLLFDSTEEREVGGAKVKAGTSVKEQYVDKLFALMRGIVADASKFKSLRPPKVFFIWGDLTQSYKHYQPFYITQLDVEYTFFSAEGLPLRAKVGVTLTRELEVDKKQNPTTLSVGRRVWQVEAGQNLSWIAYQEYGDPNYWRLIAQANNISNPQKLQPGQILQIPLLENQ